MPRKSLAALTTVTPINDSRPAPPAGLTDAEAEEWRKITARLPREWFPVETHGLLTALLKHQTTYRVLCGLIEKFDLSSLTETDVGVMTYSRLLAMRARESKALMDLATRLRLTPQSRYQPDRAATQAKREPFGSIDADGKIKLAPWEMHR